MTDSAKPEEPPVETLSYEAALAELERIVDELERGETSLEDSIARYERGAALRRHCEARLAAAELRVARIAEGPDGPEAIPVSDD